MLGSRIPVKCPISIDRTTNRSESFVISAVFLTLSVRLSHLRIRSDNCVLCLLCMVQRHDFKFALDDEGKDWQADDMDALDSAKKHQVRL